MTVVTETELVQMSLFLAACVSSGQVASLICISPIIAYITVGALLGPSLADFVPTAAGVMLAGLLGIQLSVIDAGLNTDLDELKRTAPRALLVAVLGVLFPIGGTILVLSVADVLEKNFNAGTSLRSAFAAGSAIAPTSLGVTARLLAEVEELQTSLGILVSVAAVFDDVISLVLLAEVSAIADDAPTAWLLINPVLFSLAFILGALLITFPLARLLKFGFNLFHVPEQFTARLSLWSLIVMAIGATYLAKLARTSFLLAGYMTGIAFGRVPHEMAKRPWDEHVKVFANPLSMLFFAATIGFVIPIKDLFTSGTLGVGALLAVVGVLGKMLCGLGMLPNTVDGIAVGVAMLGRGEFGFLIASQARALGLLTDRAYAATIWGVFIPTLLAPIIFGPVFSWRKRRLSSSQADSAVEMPPSGIVDSENSACHSNHGTAAALAGVEDGIHVGSLEVCPETICLTDLNGNN